KKFTIYYGGATTETGALAALNSVGVEAYSLGEPSTEDGPTLGTPNTFAFGFTDIGGTAVFTPTAKDDTLTANSGAPTSVTVLPVNRAPVAVADSATTAEDTAATIAVLGNDADADGDTLSAVLVSAPAHGTAVCTTTCTYTPAANYHGADSFTYKASDGKL